MSDLLPPSATKQERALASISERIEKLPVIYRKLWNPDLCPVELLPYLAWAFSLDDWNDKWPEHIKRQSLKDALYQHRIKGSLKAVENAIARFGTTAISPNGGSNRLKVSRTLSAWIFLHRIMNGSCRCMEKRGMTVPGYSCGQRLFRFNTSRVYRVQVQSYG